MDKMADSGINMRKSIAMGHDCGHEAAAKPGKPKPKPKPGYGKPKPIKMDDGEADGFSVRLY